MTGVAGSSPFPTGGTWMRTVAVPLLLVALFIATRITMVWLLGFEGASFLPNDISYYGYHLDRLERGEPDVLPEYPIPAVWILQAVYRVGGGWEHWTPYFAGFMLILDALTAVLLYRRARPGASLFWILFIFFNGAILWFRFDLLTSVLVAWAGLAARRLPQLSGALIGVGAAIKLWPALLIGPLLAPRPLSRTPTLGRSRLIGFAIAGFGLALASLLTHGWNRTASPLSWQSERGLHIESVPATPLMFLRTYTHDESWHIFMSDYNALELSGPMVGAFTMLSSILTAASLALAVWLCARLIAHFRVDSTGLHAAVLIAMLTIVVAMMVSNKVYSPQYTLWLGGPVAVLLTMEVNSWLRRHLLVVAVTSHAVALLTQLAYPWAAEGIMALPLGNGLDTSVLILRNLLLVLLLAHCVYLSWRTSRTSGGAGRLSSQAIVGAVPWNQAKLGR